MGSGNPKGTNRGGGMRPGGRQYVARPDGTIWTVGKKVCRLMKQCGSTYKKVTLMLPDGDGVSRKRTVEVHRFIAEQLLPNPHNLPIVDHINRDKLDNRLENLRWVSRADNFWNSNFDVPSVVSYLESLGYTVIPPKNET